MGKLKRLSLQAFSHVVLAVTCFHLGWYYGDHSNKCLNCKTEVIAQAEPLQYKTPDLSTKKAVIPPFDFLLNPHTSYRKNFGSLFAYQMHRAGRHDARTIEIGVAQGVNTEQFLSQAHSVIQAHYLVDPEETISGAMNSGLRSRLGKFERDSRFPDTTIDYINDFSIPASLKFENLSMDWIYIDGDHSYQSVSSDLRAWWPKLRVGGMFTGHDFCGKKSDLVGAGLHAPWCGFYTSPPSRPDKHMKDKVSQIGSYRAVREFAKEKNLQVHYSLEGRYGPVHGGTDNPSW
eukprot:CAMPEP_0114225942 /NCGR_PEP_ID=MMETSP0058-20121206/962_1 /TAXON_ID=36894 /ORGANISM="Pyramimonas parkeae, CCMP726" /LENGTH=288 /DNA_ID=CAMNT_0001336623 /DNA_START=1199 /DNA_END=2062 /DNA_ORIENTATION=-